jgi:transcriptional regulator with XRE-family HTH domain
LIELWFNFLNLAIGGSIIFMSIPKRIKAERERLGLSQPQMGELVHAGKTTVINWEKGASAPDALQLSAMADAGADVLYILTNQRSQGFTEIELLPSDERVLVDAYRKCNRQAKQNLIQTAALLSAGMSAPTNKRQTSKPAGGVTQNVSGHVGGSVVAGNYKSK